MKKVLLLVAVAAVAAVAVPGPQTASGTTQPTILITVRVTVSDTATTFSRYRARRGWGVHFDVRNTGKVPHRIDIAGLVTPVLKPGQKARVSASLEERGRFPYKVTLNARGAKHAGWFTVY